MQFQGSGTMMHVKAPWKLYRGAVVLLLSIIIISWYHHHWVRREEMPAWPDVSDTKQTLLRLP